MKCSALGCQAAAPSYMAAAAAAAVLVVAAVMASVAACLYSCMAV